MEILDKGLKKLLPRGYAKQIATKLKTTINRVYNVVNGRYKDDVIELEVLQLIESRQQIRAKKESIMQRLNAA